MLLPGTMCYGASRVLPRNRDSDFAAHAYLLPVLDFQSWLDVLFRCILLVDFNSEHKMYTLSVINLNVDF